VLVFGPGEVVDALDILPGEVFGDVVGGEEFMG